MTQQFLKQPFLRRLTLASIVGIAIGAAASLGKNYFFSPSASAPVFPSAPNTTLSMGIFLEDDSPSSLWSMSERENNEYDQAQYKTNRDELRRVLEDCSKTPASCPTYVVAFQNMLKTASTIPSRLMRAAFINAWVNAAIEYDNFEADQNLQHSTLLKALGDHLGVCDEIAQLKLAALEMTGFSPEDIRYVGEVVTKNGKILDFHAVVEVRVGKDNWIMDALGNDHIPINKSDMFQSIAQDSLLYRDTYQATLLAKDGIGDEKCETFYPYMSFNYNFVRIYKNAPEPGEIGSSYTINTKTPPTDPPHIPYRVYINPWRMLAAKQSYSAEFIRNMQVAYNFRAIASATIRRDMPVRITPASALAPQAC